MKKRVEIGYKVVTKQGYEMELVSYTNYDNLVAKFTDSGLEVTSRWSRFVNGCIRNPLHRTFSGVGFIGIGPYNSTNRKRAMSIWVGMLSRCYHPNLLERNPTYADCSVAEVWHNFQNFVLWFENFYKEGWEIDKDLMSENGKIYSPETCCFLPKKLNLLLSELDKDSCGFYSDKRNKVKTYTVRYNGENLGTFRNKEDASKAYFDYKFPYIIGVIESFKSKLEPSVYEKLLSYAASRREQIRNLLTKEKENDAKLD